MSVPKSITRRQVKEALACLGLDANEVMSIESHAHRSYFTAELVPTDDEPHVWRRARIPIRES